MRCPVCDECLLVVSLGSWRWLGSKSTMTALVLYYVLFENRVSNDFTRLHVGASNYGANLTSTLQNATFTYNHETIHSRQAASTIVRIILVSLHGRGYYILVMNVYSAFLCAAACQENEPPFNATLHSRSNAIMVPLPSLSMGCKTCVLLCVYKCVCVSVGRVSARILFLRRWRPLRLCVVRVRQRCHSCVTKWRNVRPSSSVRASSIFNISISINAVGRYCCCWSLARCSVFRRCFSSTGIRQMGSGYRCMKWALYGIINEIALWICVAVYT